MKLPTFHIHPALWLSLNFFTIVVFSLIYLSLQGCSKQEKEYVIYSYSNDSANPNGSTISPPKLPSLPTPHSIPLPPVTSSHSECLWEEGLISCFKINDHLFLATKLRKSYHFPGGFSSIIHAPFCPCSISVISYPIPPADPPSIMPLSIPVSSNSTSQDPSKL